MSFSIQSIDSATGDISVTFDYDDAVQTINCSDYLTSADSLTAFLTNYETAYIDGKELEAAQDQAVSDVTALIGQTISTVS